MQSVPLFEDLETSTRTVMVYTNVIFNTPEIFKRLSLTTIDIPLTKKQKNADKKKISAPYGAIISVQSKTAIRGANIRKNKKKWCTICQPTTIEGGEEKRILSITERLRPEPDTDISNIIYYCSLCDKEYQPKEMKKISHFLNQVTVVISIGKHPLLNAMLFKDNLKIAGCKDEDDPVEATMILWQDHIFPHSDLWKLKPGETEPTFVFEGVMRNVGFKLGFPIDRQQFNILMNDRKYSHNVVMSEYETTNHTNVKIKMKSVQPKNHQYDALIIPQDTTINPYFCKVESIKYKNIKKKLKDKYVTFIVFSSSEIILSGRYDENMKDMFTFFVKTVFDNRPIIEERIVVPIKDAGMMKKMVVKRQKVA
jgi:hypothetical protein